MKTAIKRQDFKAVFILSCFWKPFYLIKTALVKQVQAGDLLCIFPLRKQRDRENKKETMFSAWNFRPELLPASSRLKLSALLPLKQVKLHYFRGIMLRLLGLTYERCSFEILLHAHLITDIHYHYYYYLQCTLDFLHFQCKPSQWKLDAFSRCLIHSSPDRYFQKLTQKSCADFPLTNSYIYTSLIETYSNKWVVVVQGQERKYLSINTKGHQFCSYLV